jgi:hypothetical protein
MNAKKGLMVVCAILVCAALTLGTVAAKEDHDRAHKRQGDRKRQGGSGRRGHGMGSEAMQTEFERHREAMETLREEARELKKEINQAVQAAKKGEGKPEPEEIGAIIKGYEDEAGDIATALVDERINHHQNIVSILNSEKNDMVNKLTKMILHRPGRGPSGLGNRGRGRRGEGRRGEGEGRGRGRRGPYAPPDEE